MGSRNLSCQNPSFCNYKKEIEATKAEYIFAAVDFIKKTKNTGCRLSVLEVKACLMILYKKVGDR